MKRPAGATLPKYVLGRFNKRENEKLAVVKEKVFDIVKTILEGGTEKAMNEFN